MAVRQTFPRDPLSLCPLPPPRKMSRKWRMLHHITPGAEAGVKGFMEVGKVNSHENDGARNCYDYLEINPTP